MILNMNKDEILEKSRREKWDLISLIISLVFLVFYVVKYFSQGW